MKTLKEMLAEWTDWDGAMYEMGACMGLWEPWPVGGAWPRHIKHVMWSNNPIGNMLMDQLDLLVAQGVLEKREEPDLQFRWNSAFKGDWEP